MLDASTVVLPTHGFGSFCSSTPATEVGPGIVTIGRERERNPVTRHDVDDFVLSVTVDPPPVPLYYHYMGAWNRAGAPQPRNGPIAVTSPRSVARLLERDARVVDLRPRRAYAGRHRVGSLNIELGANLATYLGWVLPYDAPFTLIALNSDDVHEARQLLARIGREEIAGWAPAADVLGGDAGLGSYRVATFSDLAALASVSGLPKVLDVRHRSEWRAGHLRDATHLPLPELSAMCGELAGEGPIWVHCAAGFRAAIAASMLAGVGRTPVLVDDLFVNAGPAGLEIESGDGSRRRGSLQA
jgi:rhodanese-related sulfurtransferase